ncbi:MAG: DNA methyltransferase [Fluviibacter sp.]
MAKKITLAEVKKRLTAFARKFKDAADEQQLATVFWVEFYKCFGHTDADAAVYESKVKMLSGNLGRIDSFIPGLLLVEHKSRGKDLDAAYSQATDYYLRLSDAERPKYIVVSDFARIRLYDLAKNAQHECTLEALASKASWFKFLIEGEAAEITEETPINREAAYTISKLHEALLRANFTGRDLEIFLTRLLFCLFADDTGVFGENNLMRKLVEDTREDGADLGSRLSELFDVFNQAETARQTTLDDRLAAFPYINGQLFAERTRIPAFDSELRKLLLTTVILDWALISPAIFGAMFQGVLEVHAPDEKRQATRRELGAHYTSERNILRVINPLFMDALREELVKAGKQKAKLQALYDKLATLKIFDPACGCGNFLVIAYRELRRFELDVIDALFNFEHNKGLLDVETLCKVNVGQFYGIEIDEAAAHIARVALYITDHQMNLEAAQRFGTTRPTVPLVSTPHIHCGNALRTDWNAILPAAECGYLISNPPFVGKQFQTNEQKADLAIVAGDIKGYGVLDFVSAWYLKAAEYINGHGTEVALVSTNSISQGEQVSVLWGGLAKYKLNINFAHRTFKWSNEGKGVAAVHCVIIGFAQHARQQKTLFNYSNPTDNEPTAVLVKRINAYLTEADWILLENRRNPVCGVSEIRYGSFALDDGNFTLSKAERDEFIANSASQAIALRPFVGARELLHNEDRFAIWLLGLSPDKVKQMPNVLERVAKVKAWREKSDRTTTVALAKTPMLFAEVRQPETSYLAIPTASSERRTYIPVTMLKPEVIASNQIYIISDASQFSFAILTSCMHMAWVRTVCGRLKSDFRYSAGIVYNNFIWPVSVTESQRRTIEKTAQGILDARAIYPEATLADLYDPLTMPVELVKAHEANDKAVDSAYGYKGGKDDTSRAAFLFKLYEQAISFLPPTVTKKRSK